MMWIQKQHFFEIRLLVQTFSSIYRSSIDMVLKVTSNLRYHKKYIYMSFTAQLFIHCNCFSVDKFNSKYHY